jgi:hypothetical protein
MRRIFAVFGLLFASTAYAEVPDMKPMEFTAVPPQGSVKLVGTAWHIYAEGAISDGVAKRLKDFVVQNKVPHNSFIYFNSPGGLVGEALEIGKVIRANHFYTDIIKQGDTINGKIVNLPGQCYSSCTYAFLGGAFRWLSVPGSLYGVHRFYGVNISSDDAQQGSAELLNYISSMGVDSTLFYETTKAGKDGINILTPERMLQLKVIDNGFKKTKWTVESYKVNNVDKLYVKGERDTWSGVNKLIVYCSTANNKPMLETVFDVGNARDEVNALPSQFLVMDNIRYSIDQLRAGPVTITEPSGYIQAIYSLTPEYATQLMKAKTAGVYFKESANAPNYYGFDKMDLGEGITKMSGFIGVCH